MTNINALPDLVGQLQADFDRQAEHERQLILQMTDAMTNYYYDRTHARHVLANSMDALARKLRELTPPSPSEPVVALAGGPDPAAMPQFMHKPAPSPSYVPHGNGSVPPPMPPPQQQPRNGNGGGSPTAALARLRGHQ